MNGFIHWFNESYFNSSIQNAIVKAGITHFYFCYSTLVIKGTFTDGCNDVSFGPYITPLVSPLNKQLYVRQEGSLKKCSPSLNLLVWSYRRYPGYRLSFGFQLKNSLQLYKETSMNSNVWTLVETRNNIAQLSIYGGKSKFVVTDLAVRYKIV